MFTGIIEATSEVNSWELHNQVVRLSVMRPETFTHIKPGDSIAVNGVCLTVETQNPQALYFALGHETLNLLEIESSKGWLGHKVNLERSLVFGGRVDGHLVTGHVDCRVQLKNINKAGESWILDFALPLVLRPYVWPKGSCALNGVSLTLNQVTDESFSVCLIPETILRTNLQFLKAGDWVHFEIDNMARGIVHNLELIKARQV